MLEIRSLDKTMKEKKFNSYGCGFKVSNAFYTTSYVGYVFLLLLVSTLTLVQRRQEKLHSDSLKDAGDNKEVLTTQLYLYFKKKKNLATFPFTSKNV